MLILQKSINHPKQKISESTHIERIWAAHKCKAPAAGSCTLVEPEEHHWCKGRIWKLHILLHICHAASGLPRCSATSSKATGQVLCLLEAWAISLSWCSQAGLSPIRPQRWFCVLTGGHDDRMMGSNATLLMGTSLMYQSSILRRFTYAHYAFSILCIGTGLVHLKNYLLALKFFQTQLTLCSTEGLVTLCKYCVNTLIYKTTLAY